MNTRKAPDYLVALATILLLPLFLGCATSKSTVAPDPRVQFLDRSAQKAIVVQHSNRMDSDLIDVQAQLQNQGTKPVEVMARVAWFDDQGREVQPDSQIWKRVSLPNSMPKAIQEVAPNAGAVDYILYVRTAR